MGDRFERFPIFPLPLVVLPSETVPLHIFEDRYKQMINECLEADTPFGIVWLGDDGLAEIGCTVRITELLERTEDGRMNILVEGERPFQLLKRIDDLAYPAGDIELLEDRADADAERLESVRASYTNIVRMATETSADDEAVAEMDSYAMAATIELEPAFKQALLDMRSENERLDMLQQLFEKAAARLEQAERVAETAKSNGKVRI